MSWISSSVLFYSLEKPPSFPGGPPLLNTAARPFSTHHVPLCRRYLCFLRQKWVPSPVRPSTHPRLGTTAMRMLPTMWLWLSCQWVKVGSCPSTSICCCFSHLLCVVENMAVPASGFCQLLAPWLFIFVVSSDWLGFSVTHLYQLYITFSCIFISVGIYYFNTLWFFNIYVFSN
jgi:hypothetical protein